MDPETLTATLDQAQPSEAAPAPRKRRAQRRRTGHAGVKLKKRTLPSGRVGYVARWTDPDSGKERCQSMEDLGRTTAEARRAWALDKAKELERRRDRLSRGAARETGTQLRAAVETYFRGAEIGDATRKNYRAGLERFVAWCEKRGVYSADELREEHLDAFRDALREEPVRRASAKGQRGEKVCGKRKASPATWNNRLRALRVVLNDLRRRKLLPHVDPEGISTQLRAFKEEKPRAAFLRPEALRQLLAAVERHDAACWTFDPDPAHPLDPERQVATARELAGLLGVHESRVSQLRRDPGWPEGPPWRLGDVLGALGARHEPAAPFVLAALLTGARLEELLTLQWSAVNLEHKDGCVEFLAENVKTGEGREVWLDVTPSLKRLLLALKLKATGPYVFGGETPWTKTVADKLRQRLAGYGAPPFTFAQRSGQTPSLRATCATYGTNAGGVWGNASHSASAQRLGHSVVIAERRYAGRWKVDRDARDLEQAMEVAAEIAHLVDVATGKVGRLERGAGVSS